MVDQEPASISHLNPQIDRELEIVCLKCLRKNPQERYLTAEELAEDLRRWRSHETIHARPATTAEHFWKWVRRHPTLASLITVSFGSLVTILFLVVTSRAEIAHERNQAQIKSEALAETLFDVQLDRVEELILANNASEATAILAQLVREHPDNVTAANRLLALLIETPFALPTTPDLWHDGPVTMARFSPQGDLVVTASQDGTARVWSAESGIPVGQFLKHQARVNHAEFHPDGRQILTASSDGTAQRWEAQTGEKIGSPLRHQSSIATARFNPTGTQIATLSDDGVARLWETSSGIKKLEIGSSDERCIFAGFDPTGEHLITSIAQVSLKIWSAKTGKLRFEIRDRSRSSSFLTVHPSKPWLATANLEGMANVWNLETERALHKPVEHLDRVINVQYSPDGGRLATASSDGTVRLWNAFNGTPIGPKMSHDEALTAVRFSPDGLKLVSASRDFTARIWDPDTGQPLTAPLRHAGPVTWAEFSPDGERIVTAGDDNRARIWAFNQPSGQTIRLPHHGVVFDAAFDVSGNQIATASQDRTMRIWRWDGNRWIGQATIHNTPVKEVMWSSGSKSVISITEQHQVLIQDPAETIIQYRLPHPAPITSRAIHPIRQELATGAGDGIIRLWDTHEGTLLRSIHKHQQAVTALEYSPDGRFLASGSKDQQVYLWDDSEETPLWGPVRQNGSITSLSFHPDAKTLVTSDTNGTAIIRASTTGEQTARLEHAGPIHFVSFSPSGRSIVTASGDDTAQVWLSATGTPIGEPLQHEGGVNHAAFDSEERRLATAANDGTVRLWNLANQKLIWSPIHQENRMLRVQFSEDNTQLLAAGDTSALVWQPPRLPTEPGPTWLGPLAETIVGARRQASHAPETTDEKPFFDRHQEILSSEGSDFYHNWARNRFREARGGQRTPQLSRNHVEHLKLDALKTMLLRHPNHGWAHWFYGVQTKLTNIHNQPHLDLLATFHLGLGRNLLEDQIDQSELNDYLQEFRGLRFNGTDQFIECSHLPFHEWEAFTIEAWVWNWQGKILSEGRGGDPESSIWLASVQGSSESVIYSSGWECEGANYTETLVEADDRKWTHVAMVYNGRELILFLNGQEVGRQESPRPGPFISDRPFLIAAQLEPNFTYYGKGILNSLQISRAARYETDFVPQKPITRHPKAELLYHFSQGTGDQAMDLSGNDRHGRIVGPSWVTWEK